MALQSKVSILPHAALPQLETRTPPTSVSIASSPLQGEQLIRLAVLLTFCDPLPRQGLQTLSLSRKQWRQLLRWLDISGLALYFLNRLEELNLCSLLPPSVFSRLHRNLIDNTQRTRSMISESIAIQHAFQKAGVTYAILKGLSLCPYSAPQPELRSQFDLDFLISETSAPEARTILERRGYRLYAVSGGSWEFKFNERPGLSLNDIYKDYRSYAVELHVDTSVPGIQSPLDRFECRHLHGMSMPSLSPVDLLLGQGLHAFKHICGESQRTAHLLEFRRHVLYRHDDNLYWLELHAAAKSNPRASVGLGVVILLITLVMGDFAPPALTNWTVDALPRPVRLWVEMYGHCVALGGYPGNKLYLLLLKELRLEGIPEKRSPRQALLPSRLPPLLIRAFPNETLQVRLRRYFMQLQLILQRLRFHIIEGLRFALESRRWRRMKELAQ